MRHLVNLLLVCGVELLTAAGWPMLHGDARHSGYTEGSLPEKVALRWAVEFPGERLGTAMEPIISNGKVFIATHSGNLYALDGETGQGAWKVVTGAPILHSPAAGDEKIITANMAGSIFALDTARGETKWAHYAVGDSFSVSPAIHQGKVVIGSRTGDLYAFDLRTGNLQWKKSLPAPIRQTAAADGRFVYVTSEDLRLRCFDLENGNVIWTSEQMSGQTARDYYPVILTRDGKTYVTTRTNPVLSMGNHIGRDRTLITRNAGVDDSDWRKIDAYVKSTNALGNPDLWQKEQEAIIAYQKEKPEQRSFYIFDAETGREPHIPPVLWIAGCQAVGAMPARTRGDQLFVFYRTAYGNWTHGVAPLVGLGLYDPGSNSITPIHHTRGMQPPWNTFWGTADEAQNFNVVGDDVLLVHQGTLSALNLKTHNLRALWGDRDTYGGFRSPPWARNEWHGPGRGSVAVDSGRIYWITGSRLLCLAEGQKKEVKPGVVSVRQSLNAPLPAEVLSEVHSRKLGAALAEVLAESWAPLYVEPGLHGREFFFAESGDYFRALSLAFPLAHADQQKAMQALLANLWNAYPPFTAAGRLDLKTGKRRELFSIPAELLSRLGQDKLAHPFGNVYAAWLYAENCAEWPRVEIAYPDILKSYEDFTRSGWKLEPKGDLFANRYLASLIAFEKIAQRKGDNETATKVHDQINSTSEQLIAWWNSAAQAGTLTNFKSSSELDPFIGQGDRISFKLAPHRHKIALFKDMTPEVAAVIRERAPAACEAVWKAFAVLYATWPYQGEERQVHYGENFIDPPDLAMDAFRIAAYLRKEAPLPPGDIPFARADLFYLEKLVLQMRP